MSTNKITKIDHRTIHFLPFLPARNRSLGYKLERKWGKEKIIITAIETLNTYDLITFLLVLKEYTNSAYTTGKIKDKEFAEIVIDVKKILKERGIINKKINRETLFKSLKRLRSIELEIITETSRVVTSYFYEIEADNELNTVKILANKKYIDQLIQKGIIINFNRILSYNKKEQYTILLDLYLQGTKNTKKSNGFSYRNFYKNDEIETALKLDLIDLPRFKKRQIIKKSFENLFKNANIKYIYNKDEDIWVKTSAASA